MASRDVELVFQVAAIMLLPLVAVINLAAVSERARTRLSDRDFLLPFGTSILLWTICAGAWCIYRLIHKMPLIPSFSNMQDVTGYQAAAVQAEPAGATMGYSYGYGGYEER